MKKILIISKCEDCNQECGIRVPCGDIPEKCNLHDAEPTVLYNIEEAKAIIGSDVEAKFFTHYKSVEINFRNIKFAEGVFGSSSKILARKN